MRIYTAYKYSHIKDKSMIKRDLLKFSDILENKGHTTFMLGRDVQNWNNKAHPVHSKLAKMIKELKEADALYAYINSTVYSSVLLFEITVAKLLGKKIVIALKEGLKAPYFNFLADEVVYFEKLDDLSMNLS